MSPHTCRYHEDYPVGGRRVNWFDRAMEEAARRNKALVTE